MARSIGGNYWKVVKTQAFEKNIFLENFSSEKQRDLILHVQPV